MPPAVQGIPDNPRGLRQGMEPRRVPYPLVLMKFSPGDLVDEPQSLGVRDLWVSRYVTTLGMPTAPRAMSSRLQGTLCNGLSLRTSFLPVHGP